MAISSKPKARPYDSYESADPDAPQLPIIGTLTTRVLVTGSEPLYASEKGLTIGQMIDNHLAELNERGGVVHSITLELPTED